jgi:hypothetical protein
VGWIGIVVNASTPKINISVTAATTAIGRSIEWRIKSMGGILPQSRHAVARHDPFFFSNTRVFRPPLTHSCAGMIANGANIRIRIRRQKGHCR